MSKKEEFLERIDTKIARAERQLKKLQDKGKDVNLSINELNHIHVLSERISTCKEMKTEFLLIYEE